MTNLRTLFKLSRPLQLILTSLTYLLGGGIARYLGRPTHLAGLGLGLLVVLALQGSSYWLIEYFHLPFTPLVKDETPRQREAMRTSLLQASFALLTGAAAVVVTLLLVRLLSLAAGLLLILVVLAFLTFAVPPLRWSESGYGELILATAIGTLVPAFAFLLQFGNVHRLLTFVTFPLTLLILAYLLVCDFPTFATDQKLGRHTLLTRLTWQYAIPIHHVLVLAAFLLFAISPYLGFPWRLDWPVYFALPFALVQIVWMQRIASGGRTLWNFFTALALATAGLTAYLLVFTFWTR